MNKEPTLYRLKVHNEINAERVKASFEYHFKKHSSCYDPCASRNRKCTCILKLPDDLDNFYAQFAEFIKKFPSTGCESWVEVWKPVKGSGPQSYEYRLPFGRHISTTTICTLTLTNMLPIALAERKKVLKLIKSRVHMVHLEKTTKFAAPTPVTEEITWENLTLNIKEDSIDASVDYIITNRRLFKKNSQDKFDKATSPLARGKVLDLETMPFDQLEEAYNRRKRKEMKVVLESAPFDMLEESYKKRKRLTSTINLTSDGSGEVLPDGSGVAIQSQLEQQHTFLQVKKEQATEISNIKERVEEEKKKSAAHQLRFDRMKECVVCQDADRCVALFPCSHLALCAACQNLVEVCPICREKIKERRTIRVP